MTTDLSDDEQHAILDNNRRILERMIGFPRTAQAIVSAGARQQHLRTVTAATVLELVREHRAHCPGESCVVSLSLLLPIYQELIGRDLTPDEHGLFV